MSEIKPALTAEEWATPPDDYHLCESRKWYKRYHARAALALHDQFFGFTWEDVDLLKFWADDARPDHVYNGLAKPDKLLDLADRIAALLPPREQP